MKKIKIIGGAGYVGTRLSNYLHSLGYEIHVVDLFWFGDYLNEKITKTKKNLWELKTKDLEGFDVVIFLGGLSNDPMASYRPDLNFIENSSAPTYLAFITKQSGVKRYISASSCSVYGYTNNEILNELSNIKPKYPYGISKLQSEIGIMSLEDDGFKPIIFRKGTVSGWSEKMRFDLVVNTMFKDSVTQRKIVVNNPNLWRPVIDIRDVVQGYELAINSNDSGIFNLSGKNYTIGEIGNIVHNKINTLIDVELIINNIEDVRNYKVSTEKIESCLGYKSKFDVNDIVDNLLNNINFKTFDFSNDIYYNINTFKNIL